MQKWRKGICALCAVAIVTATGCVEKHITVITREAGSGTREAFDKAVTDGKGNYLQMKVNGKTVYTTTDRADVQKETGNVLTKVATDKHAIGYVSLGALNDTVKTVKINGVAPSSQTVLDGSYVLQRPFVVMTSGTVKLTPITEDFLLYLKSQALSFHASEAGCIYLTDPIKRANPGQAPIPVENFTPKIGLPAGDKIVVNGSTSVEKLIKKCMAGYAKVYNRTADEVFTIDLQGSSVGKLAVKKDKTGNVVGLSSSRVEERGVDCFNACLDTVAVIVHKENEAVRDLTLAQLYDIYTGRVKTFREVMGGDD